MEVASFHLVRDGRFGITRVPVDRRRVRSVDGLRWSRLLGTGRDGRVHRSLDPARRAMFAVWRDRDALDEFMTNHPVADRWQAASESWHASLGLVSGHGRWGGHDLRSLECEVAGAAKHGHAPLAVDRPVVVVTRASIRPTAWRAFSRAAAGLDASLAAAPGLRLVVGVGELPVLRLGTVSIWDSAADAARASDPAGGAWSAHAVARRSAERDGWFSESLFATFVVTWSAGTWGGVDPVADAEPRPTTVPDDRA